MKLQDFSRVRYLNRILVRRRVRLGQKGLVLYIQTAYPGVSLDKKKDKQRNVEIDPESASHILKTIQEFKQSTLGWYHSHPFFDASPSRTDIRNHSLYQNQFSQENLPFIATIISPYHKAIDIGLPFVRCFYNKKEVPINLQLSLIPQIDLSNDILEEIKHIMGEWIGESSNQKYLKENWQFGQKKYEKLIKSIRIIFELNKKLVEKFNLDRFLSDLKEAQQVRQWFDMDKGEVEVSDHGVLNKVIREFNSIVESNLKIKLDPNFCCDCD